MSFMQIGPLELMVVLVIAILVLGPQRLLEIIRTLGRWTAQLRRLSNEFTSALQAEIMNAELDKRQTPGDLINDLTSPFTDIQSDLQAIERETRQSLQQIADGEAQRLGQADARTNAQPDDQSINQEAK